MIKTTLALQNSAVKLNNIRLEAIKNLNELIKTNKIIIKKVERCFCGSSNLEMLSQFDRYGLPFGTQICKNCGLISQTINITEESMEIFYDNIYWDLINGTKEVSEFSTRIKGVSKSTSFISDRINFDTKKIKILEIGCGNGNRIEMLAKKVEKQYEITKYGCDYSKQALLISEKKGINTINGGMEDCLKIGEVDIIILSHVFEHFQNLRNALKHINQLTHKYSIVYVEVPGVMDLSNKKEYIYDYHDYTVLAHIHNFSLTSLTNIFKTSGFKLEEGNEFVRAIYRKHVDSPQEVKQNIYDETIKSLDHAYLMNQKLINSYSYKLKKHIKTLIKINPIKRIFRISN